LRIVIAEDMAVLRMLIQRTLSAIDGCDVVGTAADGVEALQLVEELNPDLLVLDVSMPHKDGLEVLREIRSRDSALVIVMYTSDISLCQLCLESGADYFLEKSQLAELKEICMTEQLAKVCGASRT